MNLTPNSYLDYRVGVPYKGTYEEILNSDKLDFGGSNLYNGLPLESVNIPMHGFEESISITLAPLSTTIFKRK